MSDFGFAEELRQGRPVGHDADGDDRRHVAFMPREQLINFKYVKPVSDVWSIGATFYYMLTAQLPRDFPKGRDPIDVILENRIVPVRERDGGIPAPVAEAIDCAVAARPDSRFADAGAFRAALAKAL